MSAASFLVRKLDVDAKLSDDDRKVIAATPMTLKRFSTDEELLREGAPTSECIFVVEGIVCRYKSRPDGQRQIVSFHIQGDIPDLQSLYLKTMDHSVSSVTPCRVAYISHDAIRALIKRHPHINEVLWRETLIDGSISREWVLNVGRRPALVRLAHLLCELMIKHEAVGLTDGGKCHLPLTQMELADATGLSVVHLNRSLQTLRRAGLITFTNGALTVLNRPALERQGEFKAGYLHFRK